jgi:hypothetical protein
VYQTFRNEPHIYTRHRNKLHTLSRNHIKLHICLKYPYYLNNPITLSTHAKQQQQAEHQPKQQTSQKQKKALTSMTIMMTDYHGKQSAEEVRKDRSQNHKSASNEKE